ncbi:DUF3558 domain-containing protein [Saccharothrix sp. S26]|uniref:DUF3558 domain-containing protein n=1 Tax=Saccharothrix sp. S26 TaxID=2907215 RepID=UPI001F1B2000|nr:DUF3558 domain-containing protein [Saccharothrix sp. S26]MCE6999833.1 DUF3558 domain-containing protein [Saccharothrix sp. S26]
MRTTLLAVACVLLVTGACSTGGTATPQTTTTVSPPVTTTAAAVTRPKPVTLDDKEPCSLLTPEQLGALKIDRVGRPLEVSALKATGCTWTVTGASNILVPVLHEGIETWTDGKRTGQPREVDPVAGFPAITVPIPNSPDRCDLMIDTADDQYLAVAFSVDLGFQDRFPEPCDGARQLAEAAMQNLLK